MFQFPDGFDWQFPWRQLGDDYSVMSWDNPEDFEPSNDPPKQLLADELHREMVAGHKLFGETVVASAVYVLTHKDFVFTTANPEKPIACVHLTWSTETDPTWPMTTIYRTLDEWIAQMHVEHKEYKHLQSKHDKINKHSNRK